MWRKRNPLALLVGMQIDAATVESSMGVPQKIKIELPTLKSCNHTTEYLRPKYKNIWRGCGERGTLLHCWWECKLVQPLWKTVWSSLKKLKIELPYDPVIPLLCIYPKKTKTLIQKYTLCLCLLQHYFQ